MPRERFTLAEALKASGAPDIVENGIFPKTLRLSTAVPTRL